ncbi:unnamed protein product [Miscanthus lutarioriparius]|uniref:Peptidase S8/S53 domain-containing protein n=1 Tax=Miscanthus lutarioriparius TaxID=422564 RepID=A0A811MSV4_9POAL|nr:unnamed protein product [Miscanthus lutarioriparius]
MKGMFVACSAGNDGSDGYTIMNGPPWITTVGAASVDRDFTATVALGSGAIVRVGVPAEHADRQREPLLRPRQQEQANVRVLQPEKQGRERE